MNDRPIRPVIRNLINACLCTLLVTGAGAGDAGFGAYYTSLKTGQAWEAYSRTGPYADVVVRLAQPRGRLVFWRGNSYLPYWETEQGRWDLTELVERSGDGAKPMPDRVNAYAHAAVIENGLETVTVRWRYLARFTAGNPHGDVSLTHFVEELFTIRPDGAVAREVRRGTERIDEWDDPLNRTVQQLQLTDSGIKEVSRSEPRRSRPPARVPGNPEKGPTVATPALWLKFDEGAGDETREEASKTALPVAGHKTLWKRGVSGTALQFDGYHSVVSVPAEKAPAVNGGSLTVEAWFALGAYPWNWAPVVQQGDDTGYFLGVNSHGYPGFMVQVDGAWEQLVIPGKPPYQDANRLPLFRWIHLAGTYQKDEGMLRLYVDGREVASQKAGTGGAQTTKADVRVGKAGILRVPTEGTHDTLPSEFGLDALIDEVRIYGTALNASQIAKSHDTFNPGPEVVSTPDMAKRALPVCSTGGTFRADYTRLRYYETWDNLWRAGEFADVVVGFDQVPTRFVFWRGVSYIPMLVNESDQWFTQEFNETGFTKTAPGDCEPMSDKACLSSHVRILENHEARVVVHWRYRLENPDHFWANYDERGWGDLADWYYYIYPDGAAVKILRCYSSKPETWHEWNEQIVVLGEGQHPESVVKRTPVMTLVDEAGNVTPLDWNPEPPKPKYKGNIIQMIHFTGKYSPYAIQNIIGGRVYRGERTWYSVFPSWNHWPTSQINSSGRNASFTDRAAHSSFSEVYFPLHDQHKGEVPFEEKLLMEGMTDLPPAGLTNLAKSWLHAPPVSDVRSGTSLGYSQARRAYAFRWDGGPLQFQLDASAGSPLHNVCLEIRNWPDRATRAALKINGKSRKPGPDFRQGVNIDTDGTSMLIVWIGLSADTAQGFELSRR